MTLSLWKGVMDGRPTMASIATEIALKHDLTLADLRGRNCSQRFVIPRHDAMAAIYATGRYSTTQIGRFFGDRDHTSAMHGIKKSEERNAA